MLQVPAPKTGSRDKFKTSTHRQKHAVGICWDSLLWLPRLFKGRAVAICFRCILSVLCFSSRYILLQNVADKVLTFEWQDLKITNLNPENYFTDTALRTLGIPCSSFRVAVELPHIDIFVAALLNSFLLKSRCHHSLLSFWNGPYQMGSSIGLELVEIVLGLLDDIRSR